MPSWPVRLHFGSPPLQKSVSHPKASDSRRQVDESYQTEHNNAGPSLPGVPVLSPQRLNHSPRQEQRAQHGRSQSHLFSLTFGASRHMDDKSITIANQDSTTYAAQLVTKCLKMSPSDDPSQTSLKDCMTGRCGTCNSLVRWPRHLDFFRCSVCLMINDIKPTSDWPFQTVMAEDSNIVTSSSKLGPQNKGLLDFCMDIPCLITL